MTPIEPVYSTPVLLTIAALAVLLLLILIMRFRLHAFVSLVLVSLLTALAAGVPYAKVVPTLREGFGGTLASVALLSSRSSGLCTSSHSRLGHCRYESSLDFERRLAMVPHQYVWGQYKDDSRTLEGASCGRAGRLSFAGRGVETEFRVHPLENAGRQGLWVSMNPEGPLRWYR